MNSQPPQDSWADSPSTDSSQYLHLAAKELVEPVVQSTLTRHTREVVIDPFKIYHDEVLAEMHKIQTKMYPSKMFPRLSDTLMNTMLRDKWNSLTDEEREPFISQAKYHASILVP